MSRYWSNLVHSLTPYTPGEQPQISNLLKLNTNENPYGPSPKVRAAIEAANCATLRKYPDPNATELKQTIASYYGLTPKNIFVGNSSDEILAHVFCGLLRHDRPLLLPDITYGFYRVYCELFGIEYQHVPLRDDFSLALDDYRQPNGGVVFANPNAPTGLALTAGQIERCLESNTESVVVVDEAYVDFVADVHGAKISVVSLTQSYPNLVVTQTLSKSRSLAGLRVGWAIASDEIVDGLDRVKNSFHPYTLDRLALAGAVAAFKDDAYFKQCCEKINRTRTRTTQSLESLGFVVVPSSANFVFAKHKTKSARDLFNDLRAQGILVRYFDEPRLREYLRISIGTDEDMQRMFGVLRELATE